MFELLLNAVSLAMSKDTRDGAASLIELLRKSPDWQSEICTVEARIPIAVRERAYLLEDVLAEKVRTLDYQPESVVAFRICIRELVANAFEHGRCDTKDRIRIIVDVTPTYASISVFNPSGTPFDLSTSIVTGLETLEQSDRMGRGRGLQTVFRCADSVTQVENEGVKAVVYRDVVRLIEYDVDGVPVIVVAGGHANPSLGRRIISLVKSYGDKSLILCLNPEELRIAQSTHEAYLREKEKARQLDPTGTDIIYQLIRFIKGRSELSQKTRIVYNNAIYLDLLPLEYINSSVEEALSAIHGPDLPKSSSSASRRNLPPKAISVADKAISVTDLVEKARRSEISIAICG